MPLTSMSCVAPASTLTVSLNATQSFWKSLDGDLVKKVPGYLAGAGEEHAELW